MSDEALQPDPWSALRKHTSARIALGRSGGSLPTRAQLEFRLAHARARDAVLAEFDAETLGARLSSLGESVIVVDSAARDRAEFLQRPDLGRRLDDDSRTLLEAHATTAPSCDLVIIISDGLSTLAANTQAEPLFATLQKLLRDDDWTLAPVIVARHARVALQDEIGAILHARISLILLGERPGLGSADSLGAYFTYAPSPGRTDADRNCISNIRSGGLSPEDAAGKLYALLTQARRLGLSGVALKDETAMLGSVTERIAAVTGSEATFTH
ncbi:MAG TPA: ethanolamine ammonia-lyase subunit EutC [Chthoniobacter sp.]|nr:ethanolamine ammonia-lyase subunit EutC [Chthoniobacter sp.]